MAEHQSVENKANDKPLPYSGPYNPTYNTLSCIFIFRLKPLDIAFMRAVHHKLNIVPVIAKADTLTKIEVAKLKRKV